jgi:hypothetical protein
VQQRGAEGLGVEAQAGADLRDLDRVGDEVLARLALLVGMALAGKGEGALDGVAVDLLVAGGGVLADDGEQVAEQRAFVGIEVLGDLVDRRGNAARVAGANLNVAAACERGRSRIGPLYVCLRPVRNLRPSSYRSL